MELREQHTLGKGREGETANEKELCPKNIQTNEFLMK